MWVSSKQTVFQQPTTHINMYNKDCMYPFVNCMYRNFLQWMIPDSVKIVAILFLRQQEIVETASIEYSSINYLV